MSFRTVCTRALVPAMIPALAGLMAVSAGPAMAAGPASPASPALHQKARIALGATSSIFKNAFTEAPDGAVFFANGNVVSVVDGNSAPAVALHASGKVLALAANAKDLFAEVGLTITEYSRSHGSAVRHWTVTSPFTPITAAGLILVGSTLWSWTDWSTDGSGFEFARLSRINITSSAVHIVDKAAYPAEMAANSGGLFYEDARGGGDSGFLVHVTPGGTTRAHQGQVEVPLILAGSKLYELAFRSNSDHPFLDGISTRTLARISSVQLPKNDVAIAGSSAGLLAVAASCKALTCANSTISKLAGNGKSSGKLSVPFEFEFVGGGQGAAVVEYTKGHMFLVRIGA